MSLCPIFHATFAEQCPVMQLLRSTLLFTFRLGPRPLVIFSPMAFSPLVISPDPATFPLHLCLESTTRVGETVGWTVPRW